MQIPFIDLRPAHSSLRSELLAGIEELLDSGQFTNGPQVEAFEEAFATFCGARHCVGVASGLDALRLTLQALEIGPGGEVVMPASTFVATAEAVVQAGARPVLVDVDERAYTMSAEATEAAIGARTRLLLPVHIYGQLADVTALRRIALTSNLELVEDACQAHGAERDGVRAGTAGVAAAFSFYPTKNLGGLGDGGAVVTSSGSLARRIRALREHGQVSRYEHAYVGWTSRLDTIHALALLKKLHHLDVWTQQRCRAAEYYCARLTGVGDLVLPHVPDGSRPVWHLFVVRTGDPEGLGGFLADHGIGTARHYPHPVHLAAAFRHLGTRGSFPVAERLSRQCLSLPLFAGIEERQLETVCDVVARYFLGR